MPIARRRLSLVAVAALAGACTGHGGGMSGSGGTGGSGGVSNGGAGASGGASCSFALLANEISSRMGTVGIVEWTTTLSPLASASVVYQLNGARPGVLNRGGTAPVDLKKANHRTLLLGLKPSSNYTFHIEAKTATGAVCKSGEYALPKTGELAGAPTISRTVSNAGAQAQGFIVTSSGVTYGNFAVIIDADGELVWYAETPNQTTRARMDYEGANMWMVAANEDNSTGEMRFVSMDGQTTQKNVAGLANAHHDFAVLPGKVAAMVWTTSDVDAESNLVEMNADGSGAPTTVFKIGANLYAGGSGFGPEPTNSYHCNSILYHPEDDSFTIGDRAPNLYVKVSHAGEIQWQIGGSCSNAPAGAAHCAPETWHVNHGHHLLDGRRMLLFNNNSDGVADVREFELNTEGVFSATQIHAFRSGIMSNVLGDVQRLPNGNTLVSYSTSGEILEVDPSWAPVQTISGAYGYSDWRETLYGPPAR